MFCVAPPRTAAHLPGPLRFCCSLLPITPHVPHATGRTPGRAPPWSLSLVTLSCTASTRGFSCVAFILICQYVRLLSASWPHTNPQPACAHVWRMRHTARCSPTFSAHSRHTSRPRSEVHAHTWRMRLRNREWGKGCSQSESSSAMIRRIAPRPKLGFLHVKSKETGIAINEARPSPSSAGG